MFNSIFMIYFLGGLLIGIMFGIMTALFTRFTEEKISYLGNNIAEEKLIDYSTALA